MNYLPPIWVSALWLGLAGQAAPAGQPEEEVHFGAAVRIVDEDGKVHQFTIVGDNEADVGAGRISWASPLAKAMMGARVGDVVVWRRPAGDIEVEIAGISYPWKS